MCGGAGDAQGGGGSDYGLYGDGEEGGAVGAAGVCGGEELCVFDGVASVGGGCGGVDWGGRGWWWW